jgi:glycosyltransferase involved in cell wall biosynthesis
MGVADPWRGRATGEDARIRWKHRLPSDAFVVGIFGTIIPIKRFDSCLEALAELRRRGVDWTLVVAGDAPLPDYMAHVQNRIEELDLVDAVRIFGHADRETFDELMLGVDAVLNLRYPSQKGMSAIVIRAMAAGKPTVVSDIPEWSHLPTEACWRVAPDEREPERIADRLELLATDVSARLHAAREARDFFERRGTLRHMAAQYLGVLDAVAVAPGVAAASGAR